MFSYYYVVFSKQNVLGGVAIIFYKKIRQNERFLRMGILLDYYIPNS